MMQLGTHRQGGSPVKTCSPSGVQPMGNGIQLPLDVAGQVGVLGGYCHSSLFGFLLVPQGHVGDPQRTPGWRAAGPGAEV